MLKTIEKEIKRTENAKLQKTNKKNQLEKELIDLEKKLKELNSLKVQCEKLQVGLDNCLGISAADD